MEHRECKTCKNPYCTRTKYDRQTIEVQVHLQYGWECCDKEKYLENDDDMLLITNDKKYKCIDIMNIQSKECTDEYMRGLYNGLVTMYNSVFDAELPLRSKK